MASDPINLYESILLEALQSDPRVIIMTAENRAAIRHLPERAGARFIDVGICEQTLVGAAAGLALRGRVPVVHALAAFLTLRAFEFIRTDVGIPGLPVKLVGSFAGVLSEANGPTHQALEDVALMRGIPGMRVWCPADAEDMAIGLPTILADPHPWYIRYNPLPAPISHDTEFHLGRAEVLAAGRDVTILCYGALLGECHGACARLRGHGLSVGLVNLRCLKPVDSEALLRAARGSALLVTVEDHFQTGGLYSVLAELLLAEGLRARCLPIALNERWFKPGLLPEVLEYEGYTAAGITDKVLRQLGITG